MMFLVMALGPWELMIPAVSDLGRFVVICPWHHVPDTNSNNANEHTHFFIFLLVIKDSGKSKSFCAGLFKGLVKEG